MARGSFRFSAIDRRPRGLDDRCHRPVGEAADAVAGGHERAGPEPRLDLREEVLGAGEQLRRDRPTLGPHPAGLVREPAATDIVAADDEVREVDEPEPREGIQRGHEPHGVDRGPAERRQARVDKLQQSRQEVATLSPTMAETLRLACE
jgi:hypothetical protein